MRQTEVLSDTAALAERFIQLTGENVFLTGKAGTGKTTFLKRIKSGTLKKTLVTAPTGIAALNAGGVTLHSQFQLPFGGFIPEHGEFLVNQEVKFETISTLNRHFQISGQKIKTIREAELLIIDEVSMLRADLLDAIHFVLQGIRRNKKPFGGMQVLFIGDMMQLPPVVKRAEWDILKQYYDSPFFFDARVLRENPPVYVELDKIYRQSDQHFTDILNRIRYNQLRNEDTEILNAHYIPGFQPDPDAGFIRLTTHNRDADEINQAELHKLKAQPKVFEAEIEGEFPPHIFPCDASLHFKAGAQVMFIKNDPTPEQKFYNGKIGRIQEFQENKILVEDQDGKMILVEPYTWENIRYTVNEETKEIEEEVIGTFKQMPLRLAWAITIHKSQGLTFEKAIIDIERVFASGQAYVALSRLKSLDGLVLSSPISTQGIPYDGSLSRFEERKQIQGNPEILFQEQSGIYFKSFCLETFEFSPLIKSWNQHILSYNKEEGRSEKQNYLKWAQEIRNELDEISRVADKFRNQLHHLLEQNQTTALKDRIHAAVSYFNPLLQTLNEKVLKHKLQISALPRTKKYASELEELDSGLTHRILSLQKTGILIESRLDPDLNLSEAWKELMNLKWRSRVMNDFKSGALPAIAPGEKKSGKKRIQSDPSEKTSLPPKPKKEKGQTYTLTLESYEAGKSIEAIATERGLAISTITGHFRKLITEKKIPVEKLVSPEALQEWSDFIRNNPETSIWSMREKLGDEQRFRELIFTQAWLEGNENKDEEKSM